MTSQLTIPFFPYESAETIAFPWEWTWQETPTDTLMAARFLVIDEFGDVLLNKVLNDGLSWDQEKGILSLELLNKDVAFVSKDIDARFVVSVTWDTGITQQVVPAAPETYEFVTFIRSL